MNPAIPVAVIGFTRAGRADVRACLRHGGASYRPVDALPGCCFVICNADDDAAAAQVQAHGLLAVCVMLGTQVRRGAALHLERPSSPLQLQHALRALAAEAAASGELRSLKGGQGDPARAAGPEAGPEAGAPEPAELADTELADLPDTELMTLAAPLASRRRARPDHILVIDQDEDVLRFVAEQVQRFGFEVHLARDGIEGLARLKRRRFEFVLLALASAGTDWAATCKSVRRTPRAGIGPAPSVVLLLEPQAELDWLRAEIAGVDGWLHKPLQADELLGVIGQRELLRRPDLQTTQAASLFG